MVVTLVTLNYRDYEGCKKVCEQAKNIDVIDHILVIDNFSNDGSYEKLCELQDEKIEVIETGKNDGYSSGFNFGFRYSEKYGTDIVFLCNSDVLFEADLIEKCIDFLNNHKSCGAVSGRMYNVEGQEQKSCWDFPNYWDDLRYLFYFQRFLIAKRKENILDSTFLNDFVKTDALAGSFTCFKLEALKKAGMYDENVFLYNEENIIGVRLRKVGYYLARLNNCSYIHAHHRKKTRLMSFEQIIRLYKSPLYLHHKYGNIGISKRILYQLCMYFAAFEIMVANKIYLLKSKD